MFRTRTQLLLPALAASLLLAAPASANYRVGLSEQSAALFSQPAWQSLKLKRVRYVVPWDWYKQGYQLGETDAFMNTAHSAKQEVLVMFSAKRGCYVNGKYRKTKACRAPSTKAFRSSFSKFRKRYPWAKTYAPWNEANHVSQPTSKSPKRAAGYYATLRRACKKCTVLAADVLDQSNVRTWLRGFLRASHGKGRIWGLHNYKDVNRFQTRGITNVLRTVPGQVWLTETGGIVTFKPSFKTSQKRAAKATRYLFKLADRYDSRRRGLRSKITRVYVYRWFGEARGARFDAGLVNPDGTPRKSFAEFKKGVSKHKK